MGRIQPVKNRVKQRVLVLTMNLGFNKTSDILD
jgi:hypothetical protein